MLHAWREAQPRQAQNECVIQYHKRNLRWRGMLEWNVWATQGFQQTKIQYLGLLKPCFFGLLKTLTGAKP